VLKTHMRVESSVSRHVAPDLFEYTLRDRVAHQ
jgi:hypothetical protein